MLQKHSLSSGQMADMLDQAPMAIYVCALDNWELLYANEAAEALLLRRPDEQVRACYQVAGYDRPCPFCKADKLTRTGLLIREFVHPENGRIYQMSGRIIDWDGVPAHIEYIADITERKQEENHTRALKEELQQTFGSIPCGLGVYRYEAGAILPVSHNDVFYDIMGYSKDHIRSLEQETSFLGVHPDDLPELRTKIMLAIERASLFQHTYRVWNDQRAEYRWIRLDGAVKPQHDGTKLLYGVYSDVSERVQLDRELAQASEKIQDMVNAIPGGVAIYKVADTFETTYFSDGVAELTGYSVEAYRQLARDAGAPYGIYCEDVPKVKDKARAVIRDHGSAEVEFRQLHRDGHIVWVRLQMKWMGEEDGCALLHCVFHNISDLKQAQLELEYLVNSIPGGIASFQVENDQFIPTFCSDGVMALSGHTREEFAALVGQNVLNTVYEPDRERVLAAAQAALRSGEVLDVSYRTRHKDGTLLWVHLNGRRIGPSAQSTRFYAVFTGMSAEGRLYQELMDETADGIYVVDQQTYDLLYVNEPKRLFTGGHNLLGQKCYQALHNQPQPCAFCTLHSHPPDGQKHAMTVEGTGRFYTTRFRTLDWNGIPAYVKYVQDVTEEVKTRKEKERLEEYFQTMVKNLPGGIAVVRREAGGGMVPEYLSDGFAALTGMTLEEAWALYRTDALAGVHPEDLAQVDAQMTAYMASRASQCELVYRLKRGGGGYLWVQNTLTLIQNEGGESRVYAVYRDLTEEREEQERVRQQYKEMIVQHYRAQDPNALIVGHCNITQNRILEIIDHTHSDLLKTFGTVREEFFAGIATLVVDEGERQAFLDTYLNAPAQEAFARNETEQILRCFIQLPHERRGRYAQFKVNLVETPDTGDITGILTVTDITEQTITDRILHQLSMTSYDFVIDLDLEADTFAVLASNRQARAVPEQRGRHAARVAYMLQNAVLPKDQAQYDEGLNAECMARRLEREGAYTFAFSLVDEQGDIRTKNMTVTPVDLRLGRVCLVRTDITDSVREQQGLLNMIAYTFDLAGFVNMATHKLTMYTRQTVLQNLPPHVVEDYDAAIGRFVAQNVAEGSREDALRHLQIDAMAARLEERPQGYDFTFPYRAGEGERVKQINVLWGDENHRTLCLVRADVTDMLAEERKTKRALQTALASAEQANRAKSDFLSAMSHDIRTPMNAIMGMTALAIAHLDDPARIEDCLQKISVSSKHLLTLINDILDMSKIEQSQITLNRMRVEVQEMVGQVSAMMAPQAKAAGLQLDMAVRDVVHPVFYGDALRINQILINLLSNAVKFTPEGGKVSFVVEELPASNRPGHGRYRFTVRDTGIGMTEEFLTRLFSPFTRSLTVSRVEGTGLGLSITKGLVDLMQGSIRVQSQEGQGTVFQVELDLETASDEETKSAQAQERGAAPGLDLAGRRFLVAEDNAINAEILCGLLRMYGAEAVVRPDGRSAVEAYRASPPGTFDAVLMDIQMPEMNGYEATRAIRSMDRPEAGALPIIAMTANAFAEDVQASLDAGMTAHVAKPIDVDVLQDTLRKALR